VAWGLADANGYLRGAKLYRGNLPEAKRDLESALNIELHEVPLYAAPPQDRVSEARIGIESHLGLHQVVELRYLVDCFEAVLLTQDGDKLVARGTGTNVADAMEQLLAALAPSRRAPSGDGEGV
jgi:hypothetical protein